MPRKTKVKQRSQGGRTRGRHKGAKSRETRLWNRLAQADEPKKEPGDDE